MALTLNKIETGNKSGKFIYQIIDETGKVLTERKSNRDYVAATRCGGIFFGRVDLIGKGDHGKCLKSWISFLWKLENDKSYIDEIRATSINPERPFFNQRNQPITIEETILNVKESISKYQNIAYLAK